MGIKKLLLTKLLQTKSLVKVFLLWRFVNVGMYNKSAHDTMPYVSDTCN